MNHLIISPLINFDISEVGLSFIQPPTECDTSRKQPKVRQYPINVFQKNRRLGPKPREGVEPSTSCFPGPYPRAYETSALPLSYRGMHKGACSNIAEQFSNHCAASAAIFLPDKRLQINLCCLYINSNSIE